MRQLTYLGLTLLMIAALGCSDDPTPPKLDGIQIDGPASLDGGNADGDTPVSDGDTPVSDGDTPVSDGDMPVSDGNMPVSDGDMPVSDGDMPVSDGDTPVLDGPIIVVDSTVDTAVDGSTVDGPITVVDSTVDTAPPVGEVLFASVRRVGGNTWVGSDHSTVPVRGIYVDENGAPVPSTALTYAITTTATVDTSGNVTGGTLPSNVNRETVTLTADATLAKNTLDIVVQRKTQNTVTVTGTLSYVVGTPTNVTLRRVSLDGNAGPAASVASDGSFSVVLQAGSFYTLRAQAVGYQNTHFSGVAPLTDAHWGTVEVAMLSDLLYRMQMILIGDCVASSQDTGAILVGDLEMMSGADGWEIILSDPNAIVVYVGAGGRIPDCDLTATSTSGRFSVFNLPMVADDVYWLVARKMVNKQYQYRTALGHLSADGFSMTTDWM
ncbi:MAG: hypothetical protein JRH20_09985 [Deltaproteobacteria bacterium]|nr:hypothetical protein [Deltaproteobacteria bacterium]